MPKVVGQDGAGGGVGARVYARLWQTQDDRVDADLNATLDTGSVPFIQPRFYLQFSCLDQLRQALKSLQSAKRYSASSHSWSSCLRFHK